MKATGMGDDEFAGTPEQAQGGAARTRHTFAIGRLTRRSAEIRMVQREGGAAASIALKALVRSRSRNVPTVH